jgi:pantoate--beta-alanine ligase
MQTLHHVSSVRAAIADFRREGKRIAFVPTMGNLHDGHLSLVEKAKSHADIVVVSIFVNRLQFGLNEDWDRYPRTLESDALKLEKSACDILFCPDELEMYPNGMDEQTRVIVPTMTDVLCGASRPGHFEGVTTVVTKLFNIVQPDTAIFGVKDFQQLAVIRRMVEDLCVPVEIIGAEIARESDGLAMSSRNGYISDNERGRVAILYETLSWIKERVSAGDKMFLELERLGIEKIGAAGFKVDYLKICNSKTLNPAADDDTAITILAAMYTEKARLIDNLSLQLAS